MRPSPAFGATPTRATRPQPRPHVRAAGSRLAVLAVAAAIAVVATAALGWLGYLGGPGTRQLLPATPSSQRPPVAALLISGDLGLRIGMTPAIAHRLVADGIPVLEASSLTLFRKRQTPAQVQALIADLSRETLEFSGAERLLLIGQSFGADMLHVGAPALPADVRQRVQLIALIVPGDTVQFRASPSEIFSFAERTHPALPTASQLTWAPVVCIHGEREAASLCPHLDMPNVRRIALPGGHPLNRDANALYAALRAAIAASSPAD